MAENFPTILTRSSLLAFVLTGTVMASPAMAAEGEEPSAIRVLGHPDPEGLLPDQTAPKVVSAISADFITKQAPTLNAFQLVGLLPGANAASTDPYGLSASSSLTLRGLGQDKIGVLMEGAPQNDIGYYYAYPSQFADAENVRQVALSQGNVDLDSPVLGAAGGLLSLSLDDPSAKRGALVNLSLGSYNERRGFVRVDTGTMGDSGLRAFVSYSNNRADNWRGAGFDMRNHVDGKLLKEWGQGNRASLAVSFNSAKTSTYPAPTLADWQAYGRGYNYSQTYTAGDTAYWRFYRAPFRNVYLSAPVHLQLDDRLTLDTTTYLQWGYGNSPYGTQLTTTGNYLGTEPLTQPVSLPGADASGLATVLGNWTGNQFRGGNVTKLVLQAGAHRLTAGLWYDYGNDRVTQSYTSVGADGTPVDEWGYQSKAIKTADGRLLAYENIRTITKAQAFFVADSIALGSQWKIDLGFKGVNIQRNGRNYLPGPQGAVHYDSFAALPRAAVHFRIDDRQQLFANISTSFSAPTEFALYNSYWGGDISTKGTSALKNEYTLSQELGYRYIGPNLSFSLAAFHYHFRNRQVATVINNGGALVNSTINGGGQTSYGLDGEIDWRPAKGVSLYVSGEYLRTRLENDLEVGGDYLPTRGKQAVSSPKFQFGVGSTYDDGLLFGSTALKYLGRQYSTFMNDESIPAYATLDLALGLHLGGLLDGKRTDLRVNAINITNPRVLSGVMSVGFNAQDTVGRNGTVIGASAPAYYIGGGRAFVATLSRAF
ncbi:TonB-dependent receptor domain-containing protein [Novosphingobium umbonatum]